MMFVGVFVVSNERSHSSNVLSSEHTCSDLKMGVKQVVDPDSPIAWKERLEAARNYLDNVVAKDGLMRTAVLFSCLNRHEKCALWAVRGKCESHYGYMKKTCAPVCGTCEQLSDETRCPYDKHTMPDAWQPGDLNKYFTRLTTMKEFQQYEPKVLSRPDYLPGDTNKTAEYILGPWIVVLDNVITPEEAERLIQLGHVEGFKQSVISDGTAEGLAYNGRTSSNAWCQFKCYNDTLAQSALRRVTDISMIPEQNSEYWQLLRYEEGQFYHNHHDYGGGHKNRQQGVRILTVYLYLNNVEKGGGTSFPSLNVTVLPKRGRALIWPSVLDEDPNEMDPRSFHEALPVEKGIKYGANAVSESHLTF